MTIAEQVEVLRFFAVDFSRYASYEQLRLTVERSDPVPLHVAGFPYESPALSLFLTLLLAPGALGEQHCLSLEWVGVGGEVEARHAEPLDIPPDAVVSGPFPVSCMVNLAGLRFCAPGTCEARLSLDGERLQTLPVQVTAAAERS